MWRLVLAARGELGRPEARRSPIRDRDNDRILFFMLVILVLFYACGPGGGGRLRSLAQSIPPSHQKQQAREWDQGEDEEYRASLMVDRRIDHARIDVDTQHGDREYSETVPEGPQGNDRQGQHRLLPRRSQEKVSGQQAGDEQDQARMDSAAFLRHFQVDPGQMEHGPVAQHRFARQGEETRRHGRRGVPEKLLQPVGGNDRKRRQEYQKSDREREPSHPVPTKAPNRSGQQKAHKSENGQGQVIGLRNSPPANRYQGVGGQRGHAREGGHENGYDRRRPRSSARKLGPLQPEKITRYERNQDDIRIKLALQREAGKSPQRHRKHRRQSGAVNTEADHSPAGTALRHAIPRPPGFGHHVHPG